MALSYSFLVAPGVAPVVVRQGVLGVEPDGLVVVGDRLVVLLLGAPDVSSPQVARAGLGIRADLIGDVVDRLLERDHVAGLDPAAGATVLRFQPEPRTVDVPDLVDAEFAPLPAPRCVPQPLIVDDLAADLEHGAEAGDDPPADPGIVLLRGAASGNMSQVSTSSRSIVVGGRIAGSPA